jgi:hypothetical protein
MSLVVVEYQSESARYELRVVKVGRPSDEVLICIHVFPAPPMRIDDDAMVESPVPPLVAPRMPETSDARFTSPVETAPAEALRTPVRLAMEREPKKPEVLDAYVAEMLVVEAFVKVCFPVKVLVSVRSVDEAAVTVMLAEPSKEVPLMVRGVWRVVAVLAFPEMEPEMELVKVWVPPKVLLVYVFGMVVDALIYESTDVLKFDTCDEVMARFGSAVMLATLEVPARLPMNDVVARAVVK